ncbi:ATP-binding protein [Bifidobacterium tibiigranuli]|uniref:ATP-binding protein n=1 Tax=Bifidobacterium tibiigranuli TaxID=2172043 RepID=UPI0026E9349B|nr:ATP-binding protein [Bifidobacterium tibiigranuli]MCI1649563.1 ATP-binding protein [Bifidobacterium tibiigranuli]MCI2184977.1 ATP-binding protein [Bifidobacterium tibiigranuli]MCI2203458.1 ATP-binding protein [Bifidobacterium tibiigranuli]
MSYSEHLATSVSIPRRALMRNLMQRDETDEVKVLIGVRRCGKSTLMRQYAKRLADDGMPATNMFFKRFDDFDIPLDYDASDLYEELQQAIAQSDAAKPFYVFLDEIQDVPQWERVVRRLHTRGNTHVTITGSNARLLSGDLATYLAGRYMEIPVYPLSFSEYMEYRQLLGDTGISTDDLLADYMRFGGMPGLLKYGLPTEENARQFLEDVYRSIVVKDVAERSGIRDIAALSKVSRYLFATSGNLFSVRNVANTLKSAGLGIAPKTVDAQVDALERAFVIYRAEQTGLSGKQILRPTNKYYPVDNGFRNLANGFTSKDFGAQLEGVVYMELRRRGYMVRVGAVTGGEIDFVASRGSDRRYVQVTATMLDESVRERELASLRALSDAFPRYVITLDPFSAGTTEDGIRIVRATDWLADE